MERVIKFRGKCAISGEFVYGDLIHGVASKEGNIYILPNKRNLASVKHCDPLDGVRVDPKTVGQLVGIKNEHGFSVYEGDIIYSDQWKPTTYQVCFDRGAFYIADKDKEEVADIKYAEQFKVIGNVHEHPHLIK